VVTSAQCTRHCDSGLCMRLRCAPFTEVCVARNIYCGVCDRRRTWLAIDIVSCLPLECMLTAAGVGHNYNLGHLNRWD
jgi:hypothetical protein